MKNIGIVGCGIGYTGLICASPDIVEAIDEAMKEEVRLNGIHASVVIVDEMIEMKVITPAQKPRHNHKRKPSRYGQR